MNEEEKLDKENEIFDDVPEKRDYQEELIAIINSDLSLKALREKFYCRPAIKKMQKDFFRNEQREFS